jgi:hypothetical protein
MLPDHDVERRMMQDANGHLEGLVKQLDLRVSAIEGEIKFARDEIAKARHAVDTTVADRQKIETELDGVHNRLSQLQAGQDALRGELNGRLDALEKSLEERTILLDSQQQQLRALLAAQKEETARKRLEHEKGQFMVALGVLSGRFQDGAVRYVFATVALDACAARRLGPQSFQTVTDQKTAADLLVALDNAKRSVAAADQAQGENFIKLRALGAEIVALHRTHLEQGSQASQERTALETKRRSLETTIGQLTTPEQPSASKTRRLTQVISAIIGLVLLGLAAIFGLLGSDRWLVALVCLVVGLVAIIVSWRSSDAGRGWRLGRAQMHLQKAIADLGRLDAAAGERERAARASIDSFAVGLRSLGVAVPALPVDAPAKALEALIVAAQGGDTLWRSHHPEARLLFGS